MKCENCQNEHNGEYGSGRFCSQKCSRSFSTKTNREETNRKVSETLKTKYKNKEILPHNTFKLGKDNRRECRPHLTGNFKHTDETKQKLKKIQTEISKSKLEFKIKNTRFEHLSKNLRKKIVLNEQNNKCLCGINEWNGKRLTLQLDHIDGNRNNNQRTNLRILCPNCHSITETYSGKNSFKKSATDEELLSAIKATKNIHQALKSLGMENGRNYNRAQRLFFESGATGPIRTGKE